MRVNNSTTFTRNFNGEAIKPNEVMVPFEYTELEAEKVTIEANIQTTLAELEVAKANEATQYEAMKTHIQYAYESGDVSYLDTIFSSSSLYTSSLYSVTSFISSDV